MSERTDIRHQEFLDALALAGTRDEAIRKELERLTGGVVEAVKVKVLTQGEKENTMDNV